MKATQLYLYHGTDVVIDAPKWGFMVSLSNFPSRREQKELAHYAEREESQRS